MGYGIFMTTINLFFRKARSTTPMCTGVRINLPDIPHIRATGYLNYIKIAFQIVTRIIYH